MARSNQDKKDLNPTVRNGITCHVENGISLCSHSSKRKRLQKPKIIKDDNAQLVVENLFKAEHCLNHGRKKLNNVKPCRRSERKIIPSSLWDNAVINPFFERKRRRLADSPIKSVPNGIISKETIDLTSDQECNGHLDISGNVSSEEILDNDNHTADGEENGDKPACKGHVRLRRSSRKHSSSVSSMIDSKYTIKQEHLQKITPSTTENSADDCKTGSSPQHKELGDEIMDPKKEDPPPLEHTLPLPNGRDIEHEPLSETDFKNQDDPLPCNDNMNGNKKDVDTMEDYYHVSGCEATYKSVDDEIDVKTPVSEQTYFPIDVKPAVLDTGQVPLPIDGDEQKSSIIAPNDGDKSSVIAPNDGNKQKSSVIAPNGGDKSSVSAPNADNVYVEEKIYIDSLGRRGRKRGRRSRLKPVFNHSESEESLQTVDTRDKLTSPDNEITVSKDVMTSKEALQLIDGSSFQRFYKMRTRRQTSSTEQTPEPTASTPVIKRRASSRTNSSTSKNSEETTTPTTSTTSSETKKRVKQVKPDILCSFCLQTEDERGEEMISCCLCGASGHPSCLQFSVALTQRVKLYEWECIECKKCELCRNSGDDATLLFCDDCDKGFHMSCLEPPLAGEPDGHWSCLYCVEGSDYWKNRTRVRPHDKSRKGKKSDKVSKRKQLLDDLAMFHEAQSRAQAVMTEEAKAIPKLKAPKKKPGGAVPPTIKHIELGCYEITAWYSSPYPAEYALQNKLYICEFCLKYMKSGVIASRHLAKCPARCPPGDEIYRKETISVFEVDGRKNKTYCQNLCLLAKLFLDHKTLYYDVEPFLFYILTEYDRKGCHLVGYFSKEKNSFLSYNVSCILVLPPYMKKGYGKMLIDFSYALSRNEGKLGSPEKPLSDLGLVSYRNYWKEKLLEYFLTYTESEITIKHISQTLGFNPYDIVSTLQAYGMIKYHKSNHYVLKRPEMLAAYKRKQAAHAGLPTRSIDMSRLKWTPPQQRENK